MSSVLRLISLFCFLITVLGQLSIDGGIVYTNTSTNRIVDTFQRERYFHGVNVVYKAFPFHPKTDSFDPFYSLSKEDAENLSEWGMNVIRLGVMWPGVQPLENYVNHTYIETMKGIVNTMSDYGIYSLLDCHQDVLSEKCCGEGAPNWAVQPSSKSRGFPVPVSLKPYTINETTQWPSEQECQEKSWSDYYFSEFCSSAFQNLYNEGSIRDGFSNFWNYVASEFRNFTSVIGYELLNEPWAGDIYEDPLLLDPRVADKKNLEPFYDAINTEIRKVDNEHLVFFEPVTWSDFGTGFEYNPGGNDYKNRSTLSFHYYTPPQENLKHYFKQRVHDIERLGISGFVTEFDIVSINSDSSSINNMISTIDEIENNLFSWIGWEYKPYIRKTGWGQSFYYDNGTIDYDTVRATSRTYAQAVAGKTVSSVFNSTNNYYILEYYFNDSITQPSIIYFNQKLHYPNGINITITSDYNLQWLIKNNNYIHIYNEYSSNSSNNQLVTVEITPK